MSILATLGIKAALRSVLKAVAVENIGKALKGKNIKNSDTVGAATTALLATSPSVIPAVNPGSLEESVIGIFLYVMAAYQFLKDAEPVKAE